MDLSKDIITPYHYATLVMVGVVRKLKNTFRMRIEHKCNSPILVKCHSRYQVVKINVYVQCSHELLDSHPLEQVVSGFSSLVSLHLIYIHIYI